MRGRLPRNGLSRSKRAETFSRVVPWIRSSLTRSHSWRSRLAASREANLQFSPEALPDEGEGPLHPCPLTQAAYGGATSGLNPQWTARLHQGVIESLLPGERADIGVPHPVVEDLPCGTPRDARMHGYGSRGTCSGHTFARARRTSSSNSRGSWRRWYFHQAVSRLHLELSGSRPEPGRRVRSRI